MAQRRLSDDERLALAARVEQLQLELRMLTAELRTDDALRVQASVSAVRPVQRPSVTGGARAEYLRRLYGGR
jgi:hypothetical protein